MNYYAVPISGYDKEKLSISMNGGVRHTLKLSLKHYISMISNCPIASSSPLDLAFAFGFFDHEQIR
jgi:hypothetical protein